MQLISAYGFQSLQVRGTVVENISACYCAKITNTITGIAQAGSWFHQYPAEPRTQFSHLHPSSPITGFEFPGSIGSIKEHKF